MKSDVIPSDTEGLESWVLCSSLQEGNVLPFPILTPHGRRDCCSTVPSPLAPSLPSRRQPQWAIPLLHVGSCSLVNVSVLGHSVPSEANPDLTTQLDLQPSLWPILPLAALEGLGCPPWEETRVRTVLWGAGRSTGCRLSHPNRPLAPARPSVGNTALGPDAALQTAQANMGTREETARIL